MALPTDPTKLVYERIQQIEPELPTKVIGYLLLKGYSEEELAQLAEGPDDSLQEVIQEAKAFAIEPVSSSILPPLAVSEFVSQFMPLSHASSPTYETFGVSGSCWDGELTDRHGLGSSSNVNQLNNQTHFSSIEDYEDPFGLGMSRFSYRDAAFSNRHLRVGHRFLGAPEFPVKTCHFFNKGICKHGRHCRYFHGDVMSDSMYGPNNRIDFANEDPALPPGSLQELEFEIVEILRSKKGGPVSIASLPMIYNEMYGKELQADGYLTESQRQGKPGYNLTRLLERLGNSIRLIVRPHGQHCIVLAEDAPRYSENRYNRNDPGPIVSGSKQIYLTFPAESTFTEDNISDYFSTFGQVEDVRIPCLQPRMFGFVTFDSADTVRTILAKGNPHSVCGCRVLVKPYREKVKPLERKYYERRETPPYQLKFYADIDPEYRSIRGFEAPHMIRKQLVQEQERIIEFERIHLAQLTLAHKSLLDQSQYGYSMDEQNSPKEQFSNRFDFIKDGTTSDEKEGQTDNTSTPKSAELQLPENPFAPTEFSQACR